MYTWNMLIGENEEISFELTERTVKEEKKRVTEFYKTKIYSREEPAIKQISEAAIELCKVLNLDLKENSVLIKKDFTDLVFIYKCGVFYAKLRDDSVVVGSENFRCFTREQFDAIFDFINVVKELNLFF